MFVIVINGLYPYIRTESIKIYIFFFEKQQQAHKCMLNVLHLMSMWPIVDIYSKWLKPFRGCFFFFKLLNTL